MRTRRLPVLGVLLLAPVCATTYLVNVGAVLLVALLAALAWRATRRSALDVDQRALRPTAG